MWNITLRNMQFRLRQFLLAVIGTALVFGMALLVTGITEGFEADAEKLLAEVGGDHWAVHADSTGPFSGYVNIDSTAADALEAAGAERADAIVFGKQRVGDGDDAEDVYVIGYETDGFGEPSVVEGRLPSGPGEFVVDEKVDLEIGDAVTVRGIQFRVVGIAEGRTFFGTTPIMFVPVDQIQVPGADSYPVNAVVMRGAPEEPIPGVKVLSLAEVQDDLLKPMRDTQQSINNVRLLLWLVAAIIVGAVMYVSALERVRDFAVLKAVGASSRVLVGGLAIEAIFSC
jgi:putative ABC transport system permease protein